MRTPELLGCVALAVTFAVTLWVNPWGRDVANDFGLYRSDAHAFLHGVLPYRDLFFEYPPVAAPIMAAPAIVAHGLWSYMHVFAIEMLLIGFVLVGTMSRIAAAIGASRRLAALAVGVSPLLIGAVMRSRFDLAPVALTAAATLLLLRGRGRLGFGVLALGVATKGFPIAAAPIALAWLWARQGRRPALESALAFGCVLGLVMGAAFALSPHGVVESLRFQLGRPVQLESTPASALFLLGHLGVISQPLTVFGHREFGLIASGSSASVVTVEVLGALTGAALTIGIARRPTPSGLVLAMAAALAVYATFTAGFSPQYMVWSLPLLASAAATRRWLVASSVAAAMVLTLFEYGHFGAVVAQQGPWIAVLMVRNLLMMVSIWVTAASVLGLRSHVAARRKLAPLLGYEL